LRQTPSATPQMQAATPAALVRPGAMQSLPEPGQASSSAAALAPAVLESLDIPGLHEDAIRDYVTWLQGQATSDV
jgi:hypothetical protein